MIVVRTTQGQRVTGDLRTLVASMNPNLPIVTTQTAADYVGLGLLPQRIAMSFAGSLGLIGLLLAAIGIYGVTAHAVARRTREIGIRIALGARQGDTIRMVLRQGMSLAAMGSIVGLILAAAASQLFAGFLVGVPPIDPVTFVGSAVLFAIVGMIACYVPARRASTVDPLTALRHD
jgi:ABC-type antimicrobial peptide transport system permease subunit